MQKFSPFHKLAVAGLAVVMASSAFASDADASDNFKSGIQGSVNGKVALTSDFFGSVDNSLDDAALFRDTTKISSAKLRFSGSYGDNISADMTVKGVSSVALDTAHLNFKLNDKFTVSAIYDAPAFNAFNDTALPFFEDSISYMLTPNTMHGLSVKYACDHIGATVALTQNGASMQSNQYTISGRGYYDFAVANHAMNLAIGGQFTNLSKEALSVANTDFKDMVAYAGAGASMLSLQAPVESAYPYVMNVYGSTMIKPASAGAGMGYDAMQLGSHYANTRNLQAYSAEYNVQVLDNVVASADYIHSSLKGAGSVKHNMDAFDLAVAYMPCGQSFEVKNGTVTTHGFDVKPGYILAARYSMMKPRYAFMAFGTEDDDGVTFGRVSNFETVTLNATYMLNPQAKVAAEYNYISPSRNIASPTNQKSFSAASVRLSYEF